MKLVLATYQPGSHFARCVEKPKKPKRAVRVAETGAVIQRYGREHMALIRKQGKR